MAKQLGTVGVLKTFFEPGPHGRPLTIQELKPLSSGERRELADLAAPEIGYVQEGDKYVEVKE